MVDRSWPTMSLKLHLGVVQVGVENISLKKRTRLGPYLIVNVWKGFALDTAHRRNSGDESIMWPVNGGIQQLWRLDEAERGDYLITSVQTGLALSSRNERRLSRTAVMESPSTAAWQRWRFVKVPDSDELLIVSAHSGHALDFPRHLEREEAPHLFTSHGEEHQRFLLLKAVHNTQDGPTLWR